MTQLSIKKSSYLSRHFIGPSIAMVKITLKTTRLMAKCAKLLNIPVHHLIESLYVVWWWIHCIFITKKRWKIIPKWMFEKKVEKYCIHMCLQSQFSYRYNSHIRDNLQEIIFLQLSFDDDILLLLYQLWVIIVLHTVTGHKPIFVGAKSR